MIWEDQEIISVISRFLNYHVSRLNRCVGVYIIYIYVCIYKTGMFQSGCQWNAFG